MTSSQSSSLLLLDFSAVGFVVLDTLCRPAETMPPKGGATIVERLRMTPAGTAGGTAMICAILGLQGQVVTQVGNDDAGDFLIQKFQSYGISTNLIFRDTTTTTTNNNNNNHRHHKEVQTACSMLPIRSTAERSAFFCPGTAATFDIPYNENDEKNSNTIFHQALHAKVVHLGGTGLLATFDGPPSLRLLQQAKALGRITVFDLILANEDTIQLVEPLLPFIDYFVPSIEEASALAGMTNSRDAATVARHFKERGVPNVILTMDKDGVYVDPKEGEPFSIPAHDIAVVDTTGCGDSFTAGIIVGICKGWDMHKTVAFANAVAAQIALGLGSDGDGILKSIETTEEFMRTVPLLKKTSYTQNNKTLG